MYDFQDTQLAQAGRASISPDYVPREIRDAVLGDKETAKWR